MKKSFFLRLWRFIRIPLAVIFLLYIGLVIYRIPAVLEKQKTEEAVRAIRSQKITLDDVMGTNLPPVPDPALVDATIAGIDANENGIRDDVELAIFEAYPDSAKTRAVLLQYAFANQLETRQKLINSETVTAVAEEIGRANICLTEIVPRGPELNEVELQKSFDMLDNFKEFVESRQFNTSTRKEVSKDFYKGKLRSFSTPRDRPVCDIELSSLPN